MSEHHTTHHTAHHTHPAHQEHVSSGSQEHVESIKRDIAAMKQTLTDNKTSNEAIVASMDRLAGVLEKLVVLFESANKEVYDEYNKGYHSELAKLQEISSQNEKIARGIVALADMTKTSNKVESVKQNSSMPPQPFTPPAPMAPPFMPMMPSQTPSFGLPNAPVFHEEESFMKMPIAPVNATNNPTMPGFPSSFAQQNQVAPLGALPPPPAVPSSQPPKRGILDKFSFK